MTWFMGAKVKVSREMPKYKVYLKLFDTYLKLLQKLFQWKYSIKSIWLQLVGYGEYIPWGTVQLDSSENI